jgi:hypothetical protein
LIGKAIKKDNLPIKIIIVTVVCILLTILFSAIDVALNLWVLGGIPQAVQKIYVLQTIPVAITHAVSNAVVVPLLFYPIYKVFTAVKNLL